MALLESAAIFVIALAVVVQSSKWALDAAIKISAILGIAEMAVGYLFIAFATSLPDFTVSVTASASHAGGIALGDVLGSSIANICLVLGTAALIKRIDIKREQTLESAEILFLVALVPLMLLYRGALGSAEGTVLLIIFGAYVLFVIKRGFKLGPEKAQGNAMRAMASLLASLGILVIASRYVVSSAIELANYAAIPQALIGLTIISFGTTLPELMVDFVAIRRGHVALAIGDIFGSCAINLTLVLGTAAMFNPITNGIALFTTGFIVLVGVTVFLWYLLMKHEGISRRHGLWLVLAYIGYLLVEILVSLGYVAPRVAS